MIRRPPRSTLFPYTTALPICRGGRFAAHAVACPRADRLGGCGAGELDSVGRPVNRCSEEWCVRRGDRKSTRLNSSHLVISYAVFCLKKKKLTCSLVSHCIPSD